MFAFHISAFVSTFTLMLTLLSLSHSLFSLLLCTATTVWRWVSFQVQSSGFNDGHTSSIYQQRRPTQAGVSVDSGRTTYDVGDVAAPLQRSSTGAQSRYSTGKTQTCHSPEQSRSGGLPNLRRPLLGSGHLIRRDDQSARAEVPATAISDPNEGAIQSACTTIFWRHCTIRYRSSSAGSQVRLPGRDPERTGSRSSGCRLPRREDPWASSSGTKLTYARRCVQARTNPGASFLRDKGSHGIFKASGGSCGWSNRLSLFTHWSERHPIRTAPDCQVKSLIQIEPATTAGRLVTQTEKIQRVQHETAHVTSAERWDTLQVSASPVRYRDTIKGRTRTTA